MTSEETRIHHDAMSSGIRADQEGFYLDEQNIFVPERPVCHRDHEYDQKGFDLLLAMQREHFWYRGRHLFLLNAVSKHLFRQSTAAGLQGIDLGGGCGGWLEYLHHHEASRFQELALADSSYRALSLAGPIVERFADRYQVNLLELPWRNRWDVVFLLDVIEHIPDHLEVIKQIRNSLKPGGLLFVTAPALQFFWSGNDLLAHHQRRYSRDDFAALAHDAGLECLKLEYFMFFLSPALYLSRLFARPPQCGSDQQTAEYLARTHAKPSPTVNALLEGIFSLETTLSNHISFPWGTSLLGVFRK